MRRVPWWEPCWGGSTGANRDDVLAILAKPVHSRPLPSDRGFPGTLPVKVTLSVLVRFRFLASFLARLFINQASLDAFLRQVFNK